MDLSHFYPFRRAVFPWKGKRSENFKRLRRAFEQTDPTPSEDGKERPIVCTVVIFKEYSPPKVRSAGWLRLAALVTGREYRKRSRERNTARFLYDTTPWESQQVWIGSAEGMTATNQNAVRLSPMRPAFALASAIILALIVIQLFFLFWSHTFMIGRLIKQVKMLQSQINEKKEKNS